MATLAPPVGFVEQRRGKTLRWLKVGWESLLLDRGIQGPARQDPHSSLLPPFSSIVLPGGRGTIQRIEINSHAAIIIRRYRRGGFVRYFTRDLYWDYPPRPFVELSCI